MREPYFEKALRYLRFSRVARYIGQGDIVLDVGCGWDVRALRNIAGKISLGVGVDKKVGSCALPSHVKTMCYDFRDTPWPFPDNHFDKILLLAVLEHIDPAVLSKVLSEIGRCLKPAGSIILTVPTPKAKPVLEFLSFKLGIINRDEIADHKVYYDYQKLDQVLRKHHFCLFLYRTFQFSLNSLCVASINKDS